MSVDVLKNSIPLIEANSFPSSNVISLSSYKFCLFPINNLYTSLLLFFSISISQEFNPSNVSLFIISYITNNPFAPL
jgi:hypothetical protein